MNSCVGVFVSGLYESTVSDIGGVGQAGNESMNDRGHRFKKFPEQGENWLLLFEGAKGIRSGPDWNFFIP